MAAGLAGCASAARLLEGDGKVWPFGLRSGGFGWWAWWCPCDGPSCGCWWVVVAVRAARRLTQRHPWCGYGHRVFGLGPDPCSRRRLLRFRLALLVGRWLCLWCLISGFWWPRSFSRANLCPAVSVPVSVTLLIAVFLLGGVIVGWPSLRCAWGENPWSGLLDRETATRWSRSL